MRTIFHVVMSAYLQILAWVSQLSSAVAANGCPPGRSDYAVASWIAASFIIAIICCVWAIAERLHNSAYHTRMTALLARSRAETRFRESMISACPEAIAVLGSDLANPMTYRGGGALLHACLNGPDATALASKLHVLMSTGEAFRLKVRTASLPAVFVRGCAVGSRAVVFFRTDEDVGPDADYRAALDALPLPVWIRNRHQVLTWANRAFVAACGQPTLRDAVLADACLDSSERELSKAASEGGDIVNTRRYALIDGRRRALAIDIRRLPDASVAGFAVDMTEAATAEAKLQLQSDAFADLLDHLDIAVAVVDGDHRLAAYNDAFVHLWQIKESWLEGRPSFDEVLDRLREMRRLPEQRDFAAWKREQVCLPKNGRPRESDVWHSPGGLSVAVNIHPYLLGGTIYLFEDITERLRREASYNMMIQSERATLNTVDEPMAVFGPDGRLKQYNNAFVRLWKLREEDLAGEPHLTRIAELCAAQTGHDTVWNQILAGINASEAAGLEERTRVQRADEHILSLSFQRLPQAATLVTFNDLTDLERFKTAFSAPTAA